jgi:hypothetical protein
MSFRKFITESVALNNKKEHVEDHVFNGKDGADHAIDTLKGVHDRLKGEATEVKVKHDYSSNCCIVFGHDPKTDKFFVSTKQKALTDKPVLCFTKSNIDKNFKDNEADTLNLSLQHLPKVVPPSGVYMGEIMYTKDGVYDDDDKYHFIPESTVYSVKKKDDNAKSMKEADIGLIVTAKLHGRDMSNMVINHDPDIQNFRQSKCVHVIDPEVSMDKGGIDEETDNAVTKHLKDADKENMNTHPDAHHEAAIHSNHLKQYVNDLSKNLNEEESPDKPTPMGFKAFLTKKFKDDKTTLLSHMAHVDEHHDKYNSLLTLHHHLTKAKCKLIDALNDKGGFERSDEGDLLTDHGYIVVNKGRVSKMINRSKKH